MGAPAGEIGAGQERSGEECRGNNKCYEIHSSIGGAVTNDRVSHREYLSPLDAVVACSAIDGSTEPKRCQEAIAKDEERCGEGGIL